MQVEVQVTVDVIQGEPSGTKSFKLGQEFPAHLLVQPGCKKITQPSHHRSIGEPATLIHQPGDFCRGQHRATANQHRMQTHAELGIGPRDVHGSLGGIAGHHQAG